jgi:mRNA interferase RelE/StbE
MNYTVVIERPVIKVLEKIAEPDYSKIKNAILSLATNPRPAGYTKLKGRSAYRIRKGDYRIIYEIHNAVLIIKIVAIGHRKSIYD